MFSGTIHLQGDKDIDSLQRRQTSFGLVEQSVPPHVRGGRARDESYECSALEARTGRN